MRSTIICNNRMDVIMEKYYINLIKTLYYAMVPSFYWETKTFFKIWMFKVVLASTWLCWLGIIVQDSKFLFSVYCINLRLVLFHLSMHVQVVCQISVTFYVWILFDFYISVDSLFFISHTKAFILLLKFCFQRYCSCVFTYTQLKEYSQCACACVGDYCEYWQYARRKTENIN